MFALLYLHELDSFITSKLGIKVVVADSSNSGEPIWVWSYGGLSFSPNGGNTYSVAINMKGQIYANYLQSPLGYIGGWILNDEKIFQRVKVGTTTYEFTLKSDSGSSQTKKAIYANTFTNNRNSDSPDADNYKTENFYIRRNGQIMLADGQIAGWDIDSESFYADYSNFRAYIQKPLSENTWIFSTQKKGSDGNYYGTFYVTLGGAMTCNSLSTNEIFYNNLLFKNASNHQLGLEIGNFVDSSYTIRNGEIALQLNSFKCIPYTNSSSECLIGYAFITNGDYTVPVIASKEPYVVWYNVTADVVVHTAIPITITNDDGSVETWHRNDSISGMAQGYVGSSAGYGMYLGALSNLDDAVQELVKRYYSGDTYILSENPICIGHSSANIIFADDSIMLNGDTYLNFSAASGTVALAVNSKGRITVTSSSARYKENIIDLSDETLNPEKLYNLPIRQYNYKDEFKDFELVAGTQIGIIAEEIDEVYPNACIYNNDGQPESWQDRIMIPAMLKLIQEQKKEIDTLKKSYDDLLNRVSSLEDIIEKLT